MSDFYRPETKPVARKPYRCTGCCAPIALGEQYVSQSGIYDGAWFHNKLHAECHDVLAEEAGGGWYEFFPGDLEPPERLRVAMSTKVA